ncbi:Trans-2-decenoyl-[acyl-carrier-protein] isomerase [compost metagenome]
MKLRTGYAAIGLSPDLGVSWFLSRRVGAVRAQQWLMLSDTLDAQACLALGVVDALYPDAELAGAAEKLVQRLARAASGSLAGIKTLCSDMARRGLQEQLDLEHRLLRTRACSVDGQEGVRAFAERRLARFVGD